MNSLRTRLFTVIGAIAVLQAIFIGAAVYAFTLRGADELLDSQLARSAKILAQLVQPLAPDDAPRRSIETFHGGPGHSYENLLFFQVWTGSGELLLYSENAPALTAPASEGYLDVVADGAIWHMFTLHDTARDLWFVTGESAGIRSELSAEVAGTALIPLGMSLFILLLAAMLADRYALAGVRALTGEIEARAPDQLELLGETEPPRELRPLVEAFNRLLGRVEKVLRFERRFIGDAAHEMRTPLTALQIHLHNALGDSDPAAHRESLEATDKALRRMIPLVNQLLTLSRLDPDAPDLARREFELAPVCREVLEELDPLAVQRNIELVLDAPEEAVMFSGNREAFGAMIRNIADNAIRHCRDTGEVSITLTPHCLAVQDQGPGMPADIRDRALERFVRSRDNSPIGSGLGLSIVARVADLHGCRIENAEPNDGQRIEIHWD